MVVQTLRGLLGWGWDDICHMVVAPDELWDTYIAVSISIDQIYSLILI
jgi:hypothetical protein